MIELINSDCVDALADMFDDSVDMVLTDIPYGECGKDSNGLRLLDMGLADEVDFDLDHVVDELVRVCRGSIYVFCGTEQVSLIRGALNQWELSTRLCIWEKLNPSPMNGEHIWLSGIECCVYGKKKGATFNRRCTNTVWKFPLGSSKIHPTMKPLAMMEYLIESSSNEGDSVLDICMGSGTTGVACRNLKRDFVGIEQHKEYFDIASARINSRDDKRFLRESNVVKRAESLVVNNNNNNSKEKK